MLPGGIVAGVLPGGGVVAGAVPGGPAGFAGPDDAGGVTPEGFVPVGEVVCEPAVALLPAAAPVLDGTRLVSTLAGSFDLLEGSSLLQAATKQTIDIAAESGSATSRVFVALENTVRPMEGPAFLERHTLIGAERS